MRPCSFALLSILLASAPTRGAADSPVLGREPGAISAVLIVDGEGRSEAGRMHSDLHGRFRLELGGVVLEVRDGAGFSVDPLTGRETVLAPVPARRLDLHDFVAYVTGSRPLLPPLEGTGRPAGNREGATADGSRGTVSRDAQGRLQGYRFELPDGSELEVTILERVRFGGTDLPSRVRTADSAGVRTWRISGYREEAMPAAGTPTEGRWKGESSLHAEAVAALESERAFAATAEDRGMKAAFLEWLVPGATVFGPAPVAVEEQFGALPDDPSAQPRLEWSPEWIVMAGSKDLALISGRWRMAAVGADAPSVFGQYLSVWGRSPDGWRVLADIGTDQPESRELTPRATGRIIDARAPRPMMIPVPETLSAQVEGEFGKLAFRDGYLAALRDRADQDVIVLRQGRVAGRGEQALTVPDGLEELAPRTEIEGSAASAGYDLMACWGVLHFEGAGAASQRHAFLRVWQLEGSRWQIVADVSREIP